MQADLRAASASRQVYTFKSLAALSEDALRAAAGPHYIKLAHRGHAVDVNCELLC